MQTAPPGRPNAVRHITASLIFLGTASALVLLFHDHAYDDAYITFRYARNLSDGLGFCYNPGTASLGTTTPLLTMLLALLGLLGIEIPSTGSVLTILSMLLLSWILYAVHCSSGNWLRGLALGFLTLINFRYVLTIGGESVLLCLLVAAACYVSEVRRAPVCAALFLALATLTRGEGILAAPVLLAFHLHRTRRVPWRALLLFIAVVGSWVFYGMIFLDSAAPSTLAAKMAQGRSGLFWSFWQQFWIWAKRSVDTNTVWFPLLIFIIPGSLALFRKRRTPEGRVWLALLFWILLFLAGYTVLGVAGYHWYSLPVILGIQTLISLGFPGRRHHQETVSKYPLLPRRIFITAAVVVLASFLVVEGRAIVRHQRMLYFREALYPKAADWLNQYAGPEKSVAFLEIGILGHRFHGRTLDLLGLTGEIDLKQVSEGNLIWGLMKMDPDYYINLDPFNFMTEFVEEEPWFPGVYAKAAEITHPRHPDKKLEMYRRIPGNPMPPPLAVGIRQRFGQTHVRPRDGGGSVGQSFLGTFNGLTRIDILLAGNDGFPEPGGAVFKLFDGVPRGREVVRLELPPGWHFGPLRHYPIRLPEPLDSEGKRYTFEIRSAVETEQLPALLSSDSNQYAEGSLLLDGEETGGDLVFRVWYEDREFREDGRSRPGQ